MDENRNGTKLFRKLRPILIGLLVVVAFGIGTWQIFKEQTYVISALGMDDMGRQAFCQMLNSDAGDADDVNIICEGFHSEMNRNIGTTPIFLLTKILTSNNISHAKDSKGCSS